MNNVLDDGQMEAMPEWLKEARVYEQKGDVAAAEKRYMQQLEIEPESDAVFCELAGLACKVRNYGAAMTFANKAVMLNPNNAVAVTYLGVALSTNGHIQQAQVCFAKAVDADPTYPMPLYHLASIEKEQYNNNEKAKELLEKLLTINPNVPGALNLKGVILAEEGRQDEALECYKKALTFGVDVDRVCANIGNVMLKRQWFDEAASYFEKAYKHSPDNIEYLSNALLANNKADNFDVYFELLKDAKKKGFDALALLRNEASYWIVKGSNEEAKRCAEEMLALNKSYVGAYVVLSTVKKMKLGDAESERYIKEMEQLLEKGRLDKKQQANLLFALGKSYNDMELYDQAFLAYKKANRYKRAQNSTWKKELEFRVSWLKEGVSSGAYKRQEVVGDETNAPIFIVGMPRSGTSLIEQILSMHSSVTAAGELLYMPQAIEALVNIKSEKDNVSPARLSALAGSEIKNHAHTYLDKVSKKLGVYERFTDKLPTNYESLGVIRLMFPHAKIIHCCRHPLDVCLSIYFQDFSASLDFSDHLGDISFVYKSYVELMEVWSSQFSEDIYNVSYERVVDNPESEVKRLLEFCGLEWEDKCLEFYKSKNNVSTSSSMQVNQPLYKTSKQRWKHYDKHIASLKRELCDVIAEYEEKWMK